MRIGVLGASVSQGGTIGGATVGTQAPPDITGTIVSGDGNTGIVPGTQLPGGFTTGPSVTGDTLMCPPGFPYDYTIHDCSNYAGSPADRAALELQASIDVCLSGGGTWNGAQCVSPQVPVQNTQLITGIDNRVLYAAGALLLLMTFMGGRR